MFRVIRRLGGGGRRRRRVVQIHVLGALAPYVLNHVRIAVALRHVTVYRVLFVLHTGLLIRLAALALPLALRVAHHKRGAGQRRRHSRRQQQDQVPVDAGRTLAYAHHLAAASFVVVTIVGAARHRHVPRGVAHYRRADRRVAIRVGLHRRRVLLQLVRRLLRGRQLLLAALAAEAGGALALVAAALVEAGAAVQALVAGALVHVDGAVLAAEAGPALAFVVVDEGGAGAAVGARI